jgi:hypothetical protein
MWGNTSIHNVLVYIHHVIRYFRYECTYVLTDVYTIHICSYVWGGGGSFGSTFDGVEKCFNGGRIMISANF